MPGNAKHSPAVTSVDEHHRYMLIRLIDCCLREDIRGLVSTARILPSAEVAAGLRTRHSAFAAPEFWLHKPLTASDGLWLPVRRCDYMQHWKATTPCWLVTHQTMPATLGETARHWLSLLSANLPPTRHDYYDRYLMEFDSAVEQRRWSTTLNLPALASMHRGWSAQQDLEQLAAHQDHPFYPTARAKMGLSQKDLIAYAPEAMNTFELGWLAVPRQAIDGDLADFTPKFERVGLPAALEKSHALVPLHPLTADTYWEEHLPELNQNLQARFSDPEALAIMAPNRRVSVRPTLSVRTLCLTEAPWVHLKLPLQMRSLGHRNVRTIAPSTIKDGFTFQRVLQTLENRDPLLRGCFDHCDERQGGAVDQRSDLGWIVRLYPMTLHNTTVSCVAALLARDRHGIRVIQALANRFRGGDLDALLTDYINLQLKTHLTLWLKHGIALESNQQNCMVIFEDNQPLKLLFRDNDSGRILPSRLQMTQPQLMPTLDAFQDPRIFVEQDTALKDMFITITLQLNITSILSGLAEAGLVDLPIWFRRLADLLLQHLDVLDGQGVETRQARQALLESPSHPVKYLLLSGSLLSKDESGATDINKYYGYTSPNPWFLGTGYGLWDNR
ncbi:IucA/IucC family protein [Saccharospirillum impatiens]|uniref:IucA/IucC family protein n=1 Tax=Saccharospirillum impatiens TaxID=169438 RepID=UPI00041E5470|nr:IucA/IucC family protein [Saccharospirillum impatiens]